MSSKMFQRFLTLVLISCMLIQLFPMNLKAEQNSGNPEETTSEQIQLNENNDEVTNTETENTDEQVFPDPTVIPEPTDTQETLYPTASFDASVTPGVTEELVEKQEPVEEPVEEEQEPEESIEPIVEETEEPDIEVVDDGITYLFFGSNYDKSESALTDILSRIETDAKYELIDYVGLTGTFVMDSTDDVFTEVTSAHERLNASKVDLLTSKQLVCEDNAGILNCESGLLYQDDYVYVYGITEKSLTLGTTSYDEIMDFKNWAAVSDSSKVLVVLAETAIHANTGTNVCGEDWHKALNEVAMTDGKVTRDIVVLFGGTQESLYLPVGSDMTVQGYGKTDDSQIQYTYLSNVNLAGDHSSVVLAVDEESVWMNKLDIDAEESVFIDEFERYVEPVAKLQTFEWYDSYTERTIYATTTAIEMTAEDVYFLVCEEIGPMMYGDDYYFAYEVDFEGYETGTEINFEFPVPDYISSANFALYMMQKDGSFIEISEFTLNDDCVRFTVNEPGAFVYGTKNVVIPEDAVMVDFKVVRAPSKQFYLTKLMKETEEFELELDGIDVVATFSNGTETVTKDIEWNRHGERDGFSISFNPDLIGRQDVNVSYEYNGITLHDAFNIWISLGEFVHESNVGFEFFNTGVSEVKVAIDTDAAFIKRAVGLLLKDGYVAYDITATGHKKGDKVKITLPVPAGVENPGVFYVDEKTGAVEQMQCALVKDGKVVFETTHFSTYVIGDLVISSETVTVTTGRDAWILFTGSSLSANTQYLISNSNQSGSGYFLTNNNGNVAANSYAIKSQDGVVYIDSDEVSPSSVWTTSTASGGFNFKNNNGYLYANDNRVSLNSNTSNRTIWRYTLSDSRSTLYNSNRKRYLRYNDGWTTSSSSRTVYLYVKEAPVSVEYGIAVTLKDSQEVINEITVQDNLTSLDLGVVYSTSPSGYDTPSGTPKWYILVGENDLATINRDTGKVTFTGKAGQVAVEVRQTLNGEEMKNFLIINIVEPDTMSFSTTEDGSNLVTSNIIVKSVTDKTQRFLYPVFYDEEGHLLTGIEYSEMEWNSSDENIATVENGVVSFKGNDGKTTVTATYVHKNGKKIQATVEFIASTTSSTTPSDGTDDFPEYPNEGAVRIDKTVTAIGNFSETGICQIELSMAGVPYTTGSEIDVIVMIDMSGSMYVDNWWTADLDRVTPAVNATKLFAETIVKNEDDTYNNNRIAVYTFNGPSSYGGSDREATQIVPLQSISSDQGLETFKSNVSLKTSDANGGTPYDIALSTCRKVLLDAKQTPEGKDRKQFVVFMSDGAPANGFEYYTNSPVNNNSQYTYYPEKGTELYIQSSESNDPPYSKFADADEYYSTLMKTTDGITIYTIGPGMSGTTTSGDTMYAEQILRNIASDPSMAFFVDDDEINQLSGVFGNIAGEIKQAATDITVEDKITGEFELVLTAPNETVKKELIDQGYERLYIEVVEYQLDENKNRTNIYSELERVYIDDATKVKKDGNTILKINADSFTYDANTHILTYKKDKLGDTEIAIRYFLYLENSVGEVADRIEAGTYKTNEYANFNYTNFQDNKCQMEYPIPQVTWNGAQVSYVFYLVNKQGQPVNRAGRVVPFQEAVYVTDLHTSAITWNDMDESESFEASLLASQYLPDVYHLFDESAKYKIHVYEDETGMNLNNHFKIDGTSKVNTTYVFNTKADAKKYSEYGIYAAADKDNLNNTTKFLCKDHNVTINADGTYKYNGKETDLYKDSKGNPVFDKDRDGVYAIVYQSGAKEVAEGFDFANTIVAFGVVWELSLMPDTVVLDYGIPASIDVVKNDALASGLVGVRTTPVSEITMNTGVYDGSNYITQISNEHWSAQVENLTSIRFALNDMEFAEPAEFYYESEVNFYENAVLQRKTMYSSVTVIPATSIYYEDNFVQYDTYESQGLDENNRPVWSTTPSTTNKWKKEGLTLENATQQTDRPGPDMIGTAYDADNVYGYDGAYAKCSTYSLGSAMKFEANLEQYGTATFEFTGTGFDIFSVTSNKTGTILVDVYPVGNGSVSDGANPIKTYIVDTYYGYKYNAETDTWSPETSDDDNSLYQIPVISVEGLQYGKYKAVISVIYSPNFDHRGPAGYDFYLDAIRIYNPVSDTTIESDTTIKDAYIADGEYKPAYHELRNQIIKASEFIKLNNTVASGIVFVDGIPSVSLNSSSGEESTSTYSITDYKNFGPNNEVYLAKNQVVSFDLNATFTNLPHLTDINSSLYDIKVQIGLKAVSQSGATYKIVAVGENDDVTDKINSASATTLTSSTEMYYDITDLNGKTVIIRNTSDNKNSILSITNIKITLGAKENASAASFKREMSKAIAFVTPLVVADAEEEKALFTVNPVMTRKILWALNGGRQSSFVEAPSDDQKLPLGPEAPEDELVEVIDPTDLAVDPGDLPEIAEKREESILEQLKPEDFFEKFNVFDAQQDNIFMRILSFIANFFTEFVLWLKKLLGF